MRAVNETKHEHAAQALRREPTISVADGRRGTGEDAAVKRREMVRAVGRRMAEKRGLADSVPSVVHIAQQSRRGCLRQSSLCQQTLDCMHAHEAARTTEIFCEEMRKRLWYSRRMLDAR